MNLLYSITSYPPALGGAELLMHQLACHLVPRHGVQVVAHWNTNRTDWLLGTTLNAPRDLPAYAVDGIPVQPIAMPEADRRRLAPWVYAYFFVQGPALRRISAALLPQVLPWARSADVVHNCRSGREGLSYASFQAARALGKPFVFTPLHHPRWGTWLHRHYQHLYRQADAVIVLTEAERQTCLALGVDERRLHVTGMGPTLAPGHDPARFRECHGLGTAPLVLFVGQKFAYKGVAVLIQAARQVWQRLPETRFVFVGTRTLYSQRLFSEVTDPRVLELGPASLQDKTDAIAACDVLCLPSAQESFGAVFTEAWSLGRPVVGGDIPATRAVIDDGVDGLLAPQDPAVLADRLLALLEHPSRAAALGRAGQAKVAARYTWPRLAERTEAVYQAVLSRGLA